MSFYAALFADRHGTILSLDPQSTVSAMILSLYSGFNRLIPHDESDRLVQTNALLNTVEHHVLPASSESLSSLQTVIYSVEQSRALPPYPMDDPISVSQIERDFQLETVYQTIDRAESLLKRSTISEELKRLVPTEKSLYMICPSLLLPYLYHHYAVCSTFDHFYCSVLNVSPQNESDVRSSKMMIRAFFEEEGEEDLDAEEYEAIKEMDNSEEELEEIELEEGEDHLPRFVTCPTVSMIDPSNELNEDVTDFLNQIPGFGTYQVSYPFCSNKPSF